MNNASYSAELDFFPVATMMGSLPNGGIVPDTAVFAVNGLSRSFEASKVLPPSSFYPVEIGGQLAFYIDDVATAQETRALIDVSEKLGFLDEAPGIQTPPGMRQNKSVHWLAEEALLNKIFQRIEPFLPRKLEGNTLLPRLSQRINMYRYDNEDVFNPHIDGDWPGYKLAPDGTSMIEWECGRSMLTMLLYLNDATDGFAGGDTALYARGCVAASIEPRVGRALFFRHGRTTGSVLHAGTKVTGEASKYVARINVMYSE